MVAAVAVELDQLPSKEDECNEWFDELTPAPCAVFGRLANIVLVARLWAVLAVYTSWPGFIGPWFTFQFKRAQAYGQRHCARENE